MSALLDSANWAKAAGPSVTPKRGPSAADQNELEDALLELDRDVNAMTQMKDAASQTEWCTRPEVTHGTAIFGSGQARQASLLLHSSLPAESGSISKSSPRTSSIPGSNSI